MAMATPNDFLAEATRHLGYTEGPRNNENTFATWYGKFQCQPWCDIFVSYVADRAGLADSVGKYAYTPAHASYFKREGRWGEGTAGIRRGDVVFFRWKPGRRISHVGIVESVQGSRVICIEGNTQPGPGGNQSDGGGVRRRSRSAHVIAGYGRPRFDDMPAPDGHRYLFMGAEGPDVEDLQKALGITVDGVFGPDTRRAVLDYQRRHGLEVDGWVGPQVRAQLATKDHQHTPPAPAPAPQSSVPAFPGVVRRGSTGRAVTLVQQRLKDRGWRQRVTGFFGPVTDRHVRLFQREHKLRVDGIVGPLTWSAMWRNPT